VGGYTRTVTSDANGNTLSDGQRTNTWDSQNRLVSCTSGVSGSLQTSAFTYGSDGLRRRGVVTSYAAFSHPIRPGGGGGPLATPAGPGGSLLFTP
jgi:hypothetical protein